MPDIVRINAGVVTQAPTASEAIRQNAARMARVRAALRRAGIADRDIQTSAISLQPEYRYAENQPPVLTGYRASQRGQRPLPRHRQARRDPRRAGRRGRQPDQRPDARARQARGGARRGADPGARQRAGPGPSSMRARSACGSSGSSSVSEGGRDADAAGADDAHAGAVTPAATQIEPGEQMLSVSLTVSFELQ